MIRKEGKLLDFFDIDVFDEIHGDGYPKIRKVQIKVMPKLPYIDVFDSFDVTLVIIYYDKLDIEYIFPIPEDELEEEIKHKLSSVFGDIDVCICLERVDIEHEDQYALSIKITKDFYRKLLVIQYLVN